MGSKTDHTPRRRGRRLKRVLLGLVVLVVALAALGPTIAGPIARPFVEGAVNDQIKGHATIDSLGLSWLGAQQASVTLDDPDGGRVAEVTVRAERGLLGLALGSRKLGLVYVRGEAAIVRDADGSTNLQRAIEARFAKPDTGATPGEPAKLPRSLAASVVLDGLRVTYQDAALGAQTGGRIGAVRLGALSGSIDFAVAKPLGISIKGPIATGRDLAGLAESGAVDLRVQVTDLTDETGLLTIDAVRAEVALALTAPAIELALHAGLADGVVSRTGETRVTISTAELSTLVPAIAEALAAQPGVRLAQLPTLTLAVEGLRVPTGGDLRTASAGVRLTTSAIAGSIDLPTGETTTASAFGIEPLDLAIEAASLAETLTITGGTRATIGGASAGEVSIDLAVGGLLDEAGALRPGMPGSIAGGLRVEGFSTPILQPFVAAIGAAMPAGLRLDLPQDLGPTLDLALSAKSHTDSSGDYDIDLALDAAQAEVDAAIVIQGQRIASRGEGVRARVATLAPILDRVAAAHGVRVNGGGGVTLQASEFAIDLAKLGGPTGPDLRGTRISMDLAVTDAVGKMQLAGDDTLRDYRLERFALGIGTDDLAGEVRVTSDAAGRLNGKPFAAMKTDITLAGLLDGAGAPRTTALPSLRGEVRVEGVEVDTIDKVFGSLYREAGIVLVQDIGPRADLVLLAASNPGAGPDATDIDLTFRSSKIDITAPLTATPDRVRTRQPIVLVDRGAGSSLARLLRGRAPVDLQPAGALRISVGGLDVPFGAGGVGGVRPDQVAASVSATLTDFAVDIPLTGVDGQPMEPGRVGVPSLAASVTATPGSAPTVVVDGQFVQADQPFTLALRSTLHGLFLDAPADAADPMSVVSVGTLTPETTLTLAALPATLARLVPPGMAMLGGKPMDVVLLMRDTMGRTFDVTATTAPSPNLAGVTQFGLDLRGEGLSTLVRGRLDAKHIRLFKAEGWVGVTPRVAGHLTDLLAAEAPVKPALTSPARIGFTLDEQFELPLAPGYKPDLAAIAGVLRATVTLDAALAAITLPAAEGAQAMVIPPLSISGLSVAAKLPGQALGEAGGEASATIAGRVLQADGSAVLGLAGEASATLKGGKPSGAMPVSLALNDVDGMWVDRVLGKPALVAGSVGEKFGITLSGDIDRVRSRVAQEAAFSLAVRSPRITTDGPISFAFNKQAMYLHKSLTLTWRMGPLWANTYALGAKAGAPAPAFAFAEQTPVRLELRRLGLAMSEGVGLFKPGVFIVDATATVPDLAATLSDGRAMRVGGLELRLGRGPTPDQLGFALNIPRMKIGDTPEVTPEKSRITGRVASYTDEAGNLTPDAARLDLTGGIAPIPTEVIDAFARQNGLLRDALGPTVDFDIDAKGFSKLGGTLVAKAHTPLATAEISGRVSEGLFVVDPQASRIEIREITPELTKRFQKALPVVATLEKSREDEPAVVTFETPLELPIDGNMDRLNGKVTLDIGTARFGTADLFQRVLAIAQQKTAGEVGRRMPPLKITMADGLVSYESYALPFGEFKIESQGFINLSSKPRGIGGDKPLPAGQLQVLTFVPAGAFAAEAIPGLANLPLPVIGNLARLPIRTDGLIAKPSNNIAVDLVGKEAVNELVQPGKLLENLLGGDK